jgi:glycoside/pentoside/hexuronide:cation symporter, GPH family
VKNDSAHHQTAPGDRVSWSQLIAYGFGGVVPIALFNIAGQLMGLIGNIGLGLSAFWLGVALIIPRLWDALFDPLMGHFSDNVRTPWGRRRPFLLIGGIAVAVSFVAMWWVPKGAAVQAWLGSAEAYSWFQIGYILFGLILFFTACTIFEIPHGALGMEMSPDYHERTRLFSAKSFLGNLFAMGTPWLFALANLECFKGVGGNESDGMRWVSMLVAAFLIPMSFWWFLACREPGFEAAKTQKRTRFWSDMRDASRNRTFLRLVAIIFTLATGFNFVSLQAYYIIIFYLYGGDKTAAGPLLGITGTVWAVTGLVAVLFLNGLSRNFGKTRTLAIAIMLMFCAQASKIFCYNPKLPYLVVIPTILLSAGMLMFFTLGSSMLGDICDEEELKTNLRSEGIYCSVYWWFIKMGIAFASFVTGALILFTQFDQKQTTGVDALAGRINVAVRAMEKSEAAGIKPIAEAVQSADELAVHFSAEAAKHSASREHYLRLAGESAGVGDRLKELAAKEPLRDAAGITSELKAVQGKLPELSAQPPLTLLRLRATEIGLPMLLCLLSLWLLKFYPLTEERAYEIKEILKARRKSHDEQPNP